MLRGAIQRLSAGFLDFLWSLSVLMNFLRLSLTKAAHAAVAWCRVQEIRDLGRGVTFALLLRLCLEAGSLEPDR
jgi:hypothetical protein